MVNSLTYRTNDGTRWGTGQGSDLDADVIDRNFFSLFDAIQDLESGQQASAGIDYINITGGNQMFVHLQDHRVLGPFTLPTASWKPRGAWHPATVYAAFDVVSYNGALYLVTLGHTSGGSFSPYASDGLGHDLYALILEEPSDMIPADGTLGQILVKANGSPFANKWIDNVVRLSTFVEGPATENETLMCYVTPDYMTFDVGMPGTVIHFPSRPGFPSIYILCKRDFNTRFVVPFGTITADGDVLFHEFPVFTIDMPVAVEFAPGDSFILLAPQNPDGCANNSFTFIGRITN